MTALVLFVIFNFFNVADGLLTWYGIRSGFFREYNPVMLFFMDKLGLTGGLIVMKTSGFAMTFILYRGNLTKALIILIAIYGLAVLFQMGMFIAVF